MSTMKEKAAKAPAKAKAKAPEKAAPSVSKVLEKAMSKLPAKAISKEVAVNAAMDPAKTPAQASGKTPAKAAARKQNSREAMLARVEAVRLMQRQEGHFDCFGKADGGYCDQGGCAHHAECLSVSQLMLAM